MRRLAAGLACLALVACTARQAPKARRVGQVAAIAGVVGLMATVLASPKIDGEDDLIRGFSLLSAAGIGTFAAGDLSAAPSGPAPETAAQKHRRWAKILTERASGAARDGRCPRVLRLERRVHTYDREVHDFVFMRDPAIVKCLDGVPAAPAPAASTAAVPAADASDDADDDAVPDGAVPPSLPGVLPSLSGASASETPNARRAGTTSADH
jgi:hypothetical protein